MPLLPVYPTFAGPKGAKLKLVYHLFIALYIAGIRIASIRSSKARQWIGGRKTLFSDLYARVRTAGPIIWVHAASAGEFEQAKPVIEALKASYPHYTLLVTFFSPSGFNVAQKYKPADIIAYLPADTAANAKRFVETVNPKLVVFIKYDFWYHHLAAVSARNIPLLLVSSIFRKNQIFFKWYGGFFRKMLRFFTHIFVQDESSGRLLAQAGIQPVSVGGDTRFDRVVKITANHTPVPFIEEFINGRPSLIAGSTWPDDEKLLGTLPAAFPQLKLVIAPHEINESHIQHIVSLFPSACRYSTIKDSTAPFNFTDAAVLIIDNIGMLSRLYYYATLTYIGGGFTKSGIHNTLEAAVYGKPVIFGPNYKKFKEAQELLLCKGGVSMADEAQLQGIVNRLLADAEALGQSGRAAGAYVSGHTGATQKIMNYIAEKGWLANDKQ